MAPYEFGFEVVAIGLTALVGCESRSDFGIWQRFATRMLFCAVDYRLR